MDSALESVLTAVGLFFLGVLSPGPNFLIVTRNSLSHGTRGGILTGLGVATGDGLYAAAGMLGLSAVIATSGWLFAAIKIGGGLFLVWLGLRMIIGSLRRDQTTANGIAIRTNPSAGGGRRLFLAGLLTDLANPKTVVFFASIFAIVLTSTTSGMVKMAIVASIVCVSIVWRIGLAMLFSIRRLREAYARCARTIDRVCGAILTLLGVRMAMQ